MWALDNQTPFAAERAWARDMDGAEVWLVGVKATFDILSDGVTELSQDQVPVHLVPEFRGEPESTSLLHDADVVLGKAATDVLLDGHAYSANGPVTEIDIGFKVGSLIRQAKVFGDRRWEKSATGLTMTAPKPFQSIPLTWERAFGGTDRAADDPKDHAWEQSNPVGRGFATRAAHLKDRPLPNVENPRKKITAWSDRPAPVGFGPVAHHWMPRVSFAGTYDEKWDEARKPLLPEDFDFRYQQSAPEGQQVPGYLKGGEEVALLNLCPNVPRLAFRLPRIALAFETRFADRTTSQHRADLKSVILEPDHPRVSMVWVSELPCHHKVQKLLSTTISLKQRVLAPRQEQAGGMSQPTN